MEEIFDEDFSTDPDQDSIAKRKWKNVLVAAAAITLLNVVFTQMFWIPHLEELRLSFPISLGLHIAYSAGGLFLGWLVYMFVPASKKSSNKLSTFVYSGWLFVAALELLVINALMYFN